MRSLSRFSILVILCTLFYSPTLHATERLFTYTYESSVLNAGHREIEIWNTFQWQREEFYRRWRHRIEYEVGLGGNLQTAFYFNLTNTTKLSGSGSAGFLDRELQVGFSNEWKYKLSDPVANSVGLALYGETGIASDEIEIEGRLILDKLVGKTYHAFNVVAEPEWKTVVENGSTESEYEFHLEFDYGFSYHVNANWKLGFELRNDNEYTKAEGWVYSVLFGGPVVSYTTEGFWATLTVLPQLYAFSVEPGNKQSHRELLGHEQLETRLLFSYEL